METYINSFIRGRDLLKKLLVGDMLTAVLALIFKANPTVMGIFSIATIILFIAIVYIAVKYCRCPHCGKVIVIGVLAVDACPRCKRNLVTGKKMKKR